MGNPFASGFKESLGVEPCVVVIFGATGDLTHRKLVPALYNLGLDGLLPAQFSLVAFARREFSNESFRVALEDSVTKFSRRTPLNKTVWDEFAKHAYYVSSSFDNSVGYQQLAKLLDQIDDQAGTSCNRIFYLATGPEYFEVIARELAKAGLTEQQNGTFKRKARVIVEKPFGNDLQSAKALNKSLLECMAEDQVYRIDHYLGKETVQNLLVFRFANGIFEPIWNHKYIDHIEISVSESIGVGTRAGYFEKAGILRDIVQNHVLQLLCLVALEPPVAFEADAVRDEKVKVLRSVRPIIQGDVSSKVVRARYISGSVSGQKVSGYLDEPGVAPDSQTDTYVAMELAIDNWRWAGVPFFLRAGKRLAKRITEISVHFRSVPHLLFAETKVESIKPNVLSFQIQPDEGIALNISSKPPGPSVRVQPVKMDFSYGTSFGIEAPEAYERLLLDCMRGDATLFTRNDEIELAWEVMAPILEAWEDKSDNAPAVCEYEAGTWGPEEAEELLRKRVGVGWRRL